MHIWNPEIHHHVHKSPSTDPARTRLLLGLQRTKAPNNYERHTNKKCSVNELEVLPSLYMYVTETNRTSVWLQKQMNPVHTQTSISVTHAQILPWCAKWSHHSTRLSYLIHTCYMHYQFHCRITATVCIQSLCFWKKRNFNPADFKANRSVHEL